jgi:hypothetical protein
MDSIDHNIALIHGALTVLEANRFQQAAVLGAAEAARFLAIAAVSMNLLNGFTAFYRWGRRASLALGA